MRGFAVTKVLVGLTIFFLSESFAMRGMDYLEKYDLEDLSYINMEACQCGGKKTIFATVLDPEGLSHSVRVGNYIGKKTA